MNTQLVNIIFGMKIKQGRTEAGLTLSEFAAQCDLSPSYVTEIEKGRKYPRSDKIMKMAEVLGRSYDELVSIRLEPPLTHLGSALSSPVLGQFPYEEFGIEMSDLMTVLTRAPDKASALLHAIEEIGREYDMKEQHFLRAALRAYQELYDNYFQDLEDAASSFAAEYDLQSAPITMVRLREIVQEVYGYVIDESHLAADSHLTRYRSVFVKGTTPKLLVNSALHAHQLKFLLAREIGYQYLGLTDRAYTSTPEQVDSFQQVFNDFKASYFAGALLMPHKEILQDIRLFFDRLTWSPEPLLAMLEKYEVSPEALLYRFSEIVPQYFGVKLHFLRLHHVNGRFKLAKQLNLNRLRVPNGLAVDEHFCRRWLVVRLLHELKAQQATADNLFFYQGDDAMHTVTGVQMSYYLDSKDHFLCFGFARPLSLTPGVNTCSIIGFRADGDLSETIRFAHDSRIPQVTINETCERCSLRADQCSLRAAPPTILEAQIAREERKKALRNLTAQMRS